VLRLHVGDDFPRMEIERRQNGQGTKANIFVISRQRCFPAGYGRKV
jgi:hypothetical protein